ncbi:MAG: histidine phosphatase family protein [Syntrophales bacterium]|jgi:broad specificity phosphatase PhoE
MKMILVRHGETLWNREGRVQGTSDIALSDMGRLQVKRLAESLRDDNIKNVYSSPLNRAYETASIIVERISIPIQLESELREMDQGDFEGVSHRELTAEHKPFLQQWLKDPASVKMPNGESLLEVQDRAWKVINNIFRNMDNTLIVSHNFTLTTIICKINGISLSDFGKIHVGLASKTIINVLDGEARLELLNDQSHLGE